MFSGLHTQRHRALLCVDTKAKEILFVFTMRIETPNVKSQKAFDLKLKYESLRVSVKRDTPKAARRVWRV
jgi:hypothetical protein